MVKQIKEIKKASASRYICKNKCRQRQRVRVTNHGLIECFGDDHDGKSNREKPFAFDVCQMDLVGKEKGNAASNVARMEASREESAVAKNVPGMVAQKGEMKCVDPQFKAAIDDLRKGTTGKSKTKTCRNRYHKHPETQGKVIEFAKMSESARSHLQREWASKDIIARYNKHVEQMRDTIHKDEATYCAADKKAKIKKSMLVFPAFVMKDEKDDIHCLSSNRDYAVKAYWVAKKVSTKP